MADSVEQTQKDAIRDLGLRYAEIAALPRQQETIDRWRRLNGLQATRPMVRIDQLPWDELDWGEEKMVNREGHLRIVSTIVSLSAASGSIHGSMAERQTAGRPDVQ